MDEITRTYRGSEHNTMASHKVGSGFLNLRQRLLEQKLLPTSEFMHARQGSSVSIDKAGEEIALAHAAASQDGAADATEII